MSRTLLAGLALIGLAACGGEQRGANADTRSRATTASEPAATRSSTTRPKTATAGKRKAAPPDTSSRNPLTNE